MYMCQCELEHAQARRDLKGMLTASAPTPDQMERDDNHEPASLPAPKKNTSIMQVRFPPHAAPPPSRRNTTLTPPTPPFPATPAAAARLSLVRRPPSIHTFRARTRQVCVRPPHRSTGRSSRRSVASSCSRSTANATWRVTRRQTLPPGCASGRLSTHRSTSTSSCSHSRARCGPRDPHTTRHIIINEP